MARACGCPDLYPIRMTRQQLQKRHLGIRSGAPDVGTRGEEANKPLFAGTRTANRDKQACAIHATSLKLTRDAGLWLRMGQTWQHTHLLGRLGISPENDNRFSEGEPGASGFASRWDAAKFRSRQEASRSGRIPGRCASNLTSRCFQSMWTPHSPSRVS